MSTSREPITIPVADQSVSGLIERPPDAWAWLTLAHGAGAGMRHRFLEGLARELAERGVATVRYEFPYMEAGRRAPDRPPRLVQTVRAAAQVMREHARDMPMFAGGKSLGGRMTSTAHSTEPLDGVRGLVFFGFPLHPPNRPSSERAQHLHQIMEPVLFLQGTRDALADLDLMRPLCGDLGRRATLHIVEDGDHSFDVLKRSGRTRDEVMSELGRVTAEWMRAVSGERETAGS